MKDRTRRRRMGWAATVCPLCYSGRTRAKGGEPKLYTCGSCGSVWRWNGKPGGPVICKGLAYQGKPAKLEGGK